MTRMQAVLFQFRKLRLFKSKRVDADVSRRIYVAPDKPTDVAVTASVDRAQLAGRRYFAGNVHAADVSVLNLVGQMGNFQPAMPKL